MQRSNYVNKIVSHNISFCLQANLTFSRDLKSGVVSRRRVKNYIELFISLFRVGKSNHPSSAE